MDIDLNNIPPIDITSRKASVNGCVYEVLDYDEYCENIENNKERTDIAVLEEYEGHQILMPYRGEYYGSPISPGIYNAGMVNFFKYPDDIVLHNYIPDQIITLSNTSQLEEILKKGAAAKTLDEAFITTPNQITQVIIKDSDQPEMRCLKEAINAKHIDIDKYAGRFGPNFPNDKRQLKSSTATLNIIKRYCEHCDMEAILTIRDKNPNVPNPMNREITVSLTEPVDE